MPPLPTSMQPESKMNRQNYFERMLCAKLDVCCRRRIYEQLVNSCVSGYAYRCLGLIASQNGNQQEALRHLKSASIALPTEPTIRNDYGYVLMQSGEHSSALHEFLTAVELAPDYRQAANNLIMLLYQQGDTAKAQVFAKQFGVATEEMQQLKNLALENNGAMP